MALAKKEEIVETRHMKELKNFVARTLELMLSSREVTLNVFEKYDIVLVFSWEGDFIKGAVYQWSTFNTTTGRTINSRNKPLFISRRYLKNKEKTNIHYDEKRIRELTRQNLDVFYTVCELSKNFKIKLTPRKSLKCFW
ncbi:hypothetical protein [Planomicrobium sp. CPCC 101079]|uniref:hypothetical protein n=1 Tax=Planomicrobium sp. CPCC 101079 TaxID=2599618 RepID=UPI0011B7BAD4|nr:hypothetical protein [Planomicrobium sp. CPCC 101079]TWT00121.1 hypothetical protein FQV28_18545 [Planomicrobium sp. CPCC 101079]